MLKYYFQLSLWQAFLLILLIYFIALYIELNYIYSDALYFSSLSQKYGKEAIQNIIGLHRNIEWLNYLLVPLFIVIVSLATAFCINLGALATNLNLRFGQLLHLSFKSHIALSLGYLSLIIYKTQLDSISLQTAERNDFASVLALMDYTRMERWLHYLLQQLNLVQLTYFLMLSIGFSILTQFRVHQSILFIFCTYGVGYLTWILFIGLMQLNAN